MGLVVTALAAYIGLAELCEITYKRTVLPFFPAGCAAHPARARRVREI